MYFNLGEIVNIKSACNNEYIYQNIIQCYNKKIYRKKQKNKFIVLVIRSHVHTANDNKLTAVRILLPMAIFIFFKRSSTPSCKWE